MPATQQPVSRRLYEIEADLMSVNNLLDEYGGELGEPGDALDAFNAWMDTLASEQASKLDSYVNLIKQLEVEAERARLEEEHFKGKAKIRENRAKWLRERLKLHLEAT